MAKHIPFQKIYQKLISNTILKNNKSLYLINMSFKDFNDMNNVKNSMNKLVFYLSENDKTVGTKYTMKEKD